MPVTAKMARFLAEKGLETPCLVVDLDVIVENYRRICRALPLAEVYYAVKANPAAPILETLTGLGSRFDAAGMREIEGVLTAGGSPQDICFGNTIKKESDIARAYGAGVRLFAFDSPDELHKLSRAAPGARVYCRLLVETEGAQWPLSRKFGCDARLAHDLLKEARTIGLDPHGVSFHVGSQQVDPHQWEVAVGRAAMVFSDLRHAGLDLEVINLGGGFPARYREPVPEIEAFADAIMEAMVQHFGNRMPRMVIEPGRAICAEAGVMETEVILVARKSYDDPVRWVYLDVGMFGGLAETMGEAIRYDMRTAHDGGPEAPVIIAGPTCDGADILYENASYHLPEALTAGDRVRLLAAGAYTTAYASEGFNGFPPPREHYI